MAIKQERLTYTKRDHSSLDTEITNYLRDHIDRIKTITKANSGRQLLVLTSGIVDNLNYSLDKIHLESLLSKAKLRKNIIELAYGLNYSPYGVSAASGDLTFTMLTGVAGPGGQPIPQYTKLQTITSPIMDTITIEASSIPDGDTSISGVSCVQGVRVVDTTITASASGKPRQQYKISDSKTPADFISVKVNSVLWTKVDDLSESEYNSQHYYLIIDEDDYTYINFGDGEFGKIPTAGTVIQATYIYTTTNNIGKDLVTRVIGGLASTVSVTNPEVFSGGGESESDDSIKLNAPAFKASDKRSVTKDDAIMHAKTVPGVYNAFAEVAGSRIDLYIVPTGGGVASSYLISLVDSTLGGLVMEGSIVATNALSAASLWIEINVITYDTRIEKSIVKEKVRKAITDQLEYTVIKPGRGFTLSDTAGFVENVENGTIVDYMDFVVHTRIPTVTKSNSSAPDIVGRVDVTSLSDYSTWVITATSTTQFIVAKDGVVNPTAGTVATLFTDDGGELSFTLGQTGDTLTVGDTWRWITSKYKDNMYLQKKEFIELEYDGDLVINVYFPDEYSITG